MLTKQLVTSLLSDCMARIAPKLGDGHAAAANAVAQGLGELADALAPHAVDDRGQAPTGSPATPGKKE